MATMMRSYEAEVEPVKRSLFAEALRQAAAGTTGAAAGATGGSLSAGASSGDGGSSSSAQEGRRGLDVLDLGCGALPNARLLLLGCSGGAGGGAAAESSSSSSFSSSQSPVAIRSLVGVDSNAFMFRYAEEAAREAGFEILESSAGGGNSKSSSKSSTRGDEGGGETSSSASSAAAPSSAPAKPTARFVQASATSSASLSASGIPDESVDLVLCTLLLCSVPDPAATIAAAAAALRPGGVVAFVEHTFDPDPSHRLPRATQRALDPQQQLLADGCHLTRDPVPLFESGGGGGGGGTDGGKQGRPLLRLSKVERFRVEGGGFIAPHVSGIAVKL